MIAEYNIMTRNVKISQQKLLPFHNNSRTRGHTKNCLKSREWLDFRKYSFRLRVNDKWNDLLWWIVNSKNVKDFKNKVDKLWGWKNIWYVQYGYLVMEYRYVLTGNN